MTVAVFISLLPAFATITSLCVEGLKKILDEKKIKYSTNLVACIVSCVIGVGGTATFYILNNTPFTIANIACMVVMGVATALCSMVGYDKVVQTISQFKMKEE